MKGRSPGLGKNVANSANASMWLNRNAKPVARRHRVSDNLLRIGSFLKRCTFKNIEKFFAKWNKACVWELKSTGVTPKMQQ